MLVSNTLLVICGDNTRISCQARGPDPKGMNPDQGNWCDFLYWRYNRDAPRIERAFLEAESPTNIVAHLVSEAGITNKAVWQPTRGWEKVKPGRNPATGGPWTWSDGPF